MTRKYLIVTVSPEEQRMVRAQADVEKCSVSNYMRGKIGLKTRFHGKQKKKVEKSVDSEWDEV